MVAQLGEFRVGDHARDREHARVLRFRPGLDARADLAAVHVAEADIEDHDARIPLDHERAGVEASRCGDDVKPVQRGQRGWDDVQVLRLVVDDENALAGLVQPIERDAVLDHELAQGLMRDPAIAAGAEPVPVDMADVEPARYGIGRHAANLGDIAAGIDFRVIGAFHTFSGSPLGWVPREEDGAIRRARG